MGKQYILDLGLPKHHNRKPIEYEINNNGCWICVSHCKINDYPRISLDNKLYRLHRLVYEFYHGELDNFFCCHKCDNPSCINPNHLFIGTHADNMQDMTKKERFRSKLTAMNILYIRKSKLPHPDLAKKFNVSRATISDIQLGKRWKHLPGARSEKRNVKLTENQVLEIRELYRLENYTQAEIAKMFRVSRMQISRIVNNKHWSSVNNNYQKERVA